MALGVKNSLANAGNTRDMGSVAGSGRFPREGNGSPLQYSCLGNPMDREAWRAEFRHDYFSLSCIGEGNGNPLQCSCFENPRDGWAAVSGVQFLKNIYLLGFTGS